MYEAVRGPADPAEVRGIPYLPDFRVPEQLPHLRVLCFGDSGTGGRGQREVARAMRERMERDPAAFMLTLGDNFYPSGVTRPDEEAWEDRIVEPYHGLRIPIYASLGNHDYNGDPDAQIKRSSIDPLWYMPSRYYTFSYRLADDTNIQFFVLDTTAISRALEGASQQLRWLEAELTRSRATWKIVAGHHPMFTNVPDSDAKRCAEMLPLLARHGVALYIAGHAHALESLLPREGVLQVVCGAGGGTDNPKEIDWGYDTEFAATRGGFTILTVTKQSLAVEFVRPNSKTQFVRLVTTVD